MRYPATVLPVPLPCVMGIVNVTPDSFSDGGLYADRDAAVAHGLRLVSEGAAIVDVGGQSTRPGSEPVAAEQELGRVVPVVARLAAEISAAAGERRVVISVDTYVAAVARAALEAGATFVNDVTALRGDPEMAVVVADRRLPGLPDAHARRTEDHAARSAL